MSADPPPQALAAAQWATIARAAARVRQVREDGLHGCYGDAQLLVSAQGHARSELDRALQAVLDSPLDRDEALQAVQAGDPTVDASDLAELLEQLQRRGEVLGELLEPWRPRDDA